MALRQHAAFFHVLAHVSPCPPSRPPPRKAPLLQPLPASNPFQPIKIQSSSQVPSFRNLSFSLPLLASVALSPPSSAAEAGFVSGKINVESILVAIDDFFNRYPFFVASVTFIWLVAIPLAQEVLKKCKPISAIEGFRKLRDVPAAQLVDIRRKKSVRFMSSPNLKLLNKSVAQVEFVEEDEEGFVKEVLRRFPDPASTIICVLDNFDGDSLKAAELLYKKGFKEAYAISGGLRGKEGWQEVQEQYFPPSLHVFPRKPRDRMSSELKVNGEIAAIENGHVKHTESVSAAEFMPGRPLSPYPHYHDLKPPSSPRPSKPQR